MYIRCKMWLKKQKGDYEKPLIFFEINGTNGIELFIYQIIERFYSVSTADKIKEILKEEN